MKFKKTKIEGVYNIELDPRGDVRGYFARVFGKDELPPDLKFNIVQINRSRTQKKGTIRGLHFQNKPNREDKIVQCLRGKIYDVALDIRKNSKTFGKYVGVELSEDNKKMLLIPKGCAHAFQTLTPDVIVEYFVSEYYSPKKEGGIRWNDPLFKINWPVRRVIVSEKDGNWPDFKK